MAQTAQPTQVISAQSLAAMNPAQRAAYFGSLPADQADAARADYTAYVDQANAQFMALAIRKTAVMVPQGGGVTANFSAGQAITWNFPTAGGAYAKDLEVICNFTVNCAAGSSATYAVNAGGVLALFDRVQVVLNGVQHNFRPFWLKTLYQLFGYGHAPMPLTVLAGNSDATIQGQMLSTIPVATGNNTWTFRFRIPLNPFNPLNPAGLLPMQSNGTQPMLTLTCAPSLLGNDPIYNVIRATGGTGNAVTVTGTIQVNVEYVDGTNLYSPTALGLDLTEYPTAQYITEQQISNVVAGTINRGRITTLMQHYLTLDALVDGTTAGSYIQGLTNIQYMSLDMDSVGQNSFYKYGSASGTNISIFDFYEKLRLQYEQDVDEGIIPWIVAWGNHSSNSSNRDGVAVLNMTPGGWPDVNRAYQFGSVGGAANVNPRVETLLISLNPVGLQIVSA